MDLGGTVPGYDNVEVLARTQRLRVVRATRTLEQRTCILILPASPDAEASSRRHAQLFQMLQGCKGVAKLESVLPLSETEGVLALVLEDNGGLTLSTWRQKRKPSLQERIAAAAKVQISLVWSLCLLPVYH